MLKKDRRKIKKRRKIQTEHKKIQAKKDSPSKTCCIGFSFPTVVVPVAVYVVLHNLGLGLDNFRPGGFTDSKDAPNTSPAVTNFSSFFSWFFLAFRMYILPYNSHIQYVTLQMVRM